MNEINYWDADCNHNRDSALEMRERSAINYHIKILAEADMFNKWVYNFRYDCLKIIKQVIGKEIHGTILEIGSGTGIYSCLISKLESVKKIYTLDYSKACIEQLLPFVIDQFNLNEKERMKIFPVVGSFNNIQLQDNSIDFIVAMGALHHSEDREVTFKEVYRVLKPGGYLIACERASYDTTTNQELNKELDQEYNQKHKELMGYNVEETYTPRMNSEHKPLLAEWQYLLTKVGFKPRIFWFLKFRKGIKKLSWNFLGWLLFSMIGPKLFSKSITQILHMRIPFYPWFSKFNPDDILIVSKKIPYTEMP